MALGPGYLGHRFVPCFSTETSWNFSYISFSAFIQHSSVNENRGKRTPLIPCCKPAFFDLLGIGSNLNEIRMHESKARCFTLFAKKLRPLKTGWFECLHSAVLTANVKDLRRKQPWLALVTNTTWAMRRSYQSWQVTLLNLLIYDSGSPSIATRKEIVRKFWMMRWLQIC